MEGIYGIMTIAGPILLGAVLLWAIVNNRQTKAQERETERATRELYEQQHREDKAAGDRER